MSRVGKKVIEIPDNVTITLEGNEVKVKGPKGELTYTHRPEIAVKIENSEVTFSVASPSKKSNAYWGLTRALIANMVTGVVEGYEKKLEFVGVGYRVTSVNDKKISVTVGYSHPVEIDAPEGITFAVEGNKDLMVKGIDKNLVGLVSANIRKLRPPEPYKGKGIKYIDEVVRRKPGKTGK